MAGPVYEFGGFRLDCGRFELSRDGRSIPLERKPMDLLILLVERQGELVTRAEIAQRLWSSEVLVLGRAPTARIVCLSVWMCDFPMPACE